MHRWRHWINSKTSDWRSCESSWNISLAVSSMCCDRNERQLALSVLALNRSEMPSMQITLSLSICDIRVCSHTSCKCEQTNEREREANIYSLFDSIGRLSRPRLLFRQFGWHFECVNIIYARELTLRLSTEYRSASSISSQSDSSPTFLSTGAP